MAGIDGVKVINARKDLNKKRSDYSDPSLVH